MIRENQILSVYGFLFFQIVYNMIPQQTIILYISGSVPTNYILKVISSTEHKVIRGYYKSFSIVILGVVIILHRDQGTWSNSNILNQSTGVIEAFFACLQYSSHPLRLSFGHFEADNGIFKREHIPVQTFSTKISPGNQTDLREP